MIQVDYSAVIDAAPEKIYDVLSDYHGGHQAILPKPFFTELIVREGGRGAGTVIDVHMDVYGTKKSYHMVVSEPEMGRVLVETDPDTGEGSTFTLEPLTDGRQTRVTISSQFNRSAGFAGIMEGLMTPPITRRIYKKELENLAAYLKEQDKQVALSH
ncbi:MAG: SRPBCC family protein [Candidatus Promineifilaceae bacterium]